MLSDLLHELLRDILGVELGKEEQVHGVCLGYIWLLHNLTSMVLLSSEPNPTITCYLLVQL